MEIRLYCREANCDTFSKKLYRLWCNLRYAPRTAYDGHRVRGMGTLQKGLGVRGRGCFFEFSPFLLSLHLGVKQYEPLVNQTKNADLTDRSKLYELKRKQWLQCNRMDAKQPVLARRDLSWASQLFQWFCWQCCPVTRHQPCPLYPAATIPCLNALSSISTARDSTTRAFSLALTAFAKTATASTANLNFTHFAGTYFQSFYNQFSFSMRFGDLFTFEVFHIYGGSRCNDNKVFVLRFSYQEELLHHQLFQGLLRCPSHQRRKRHSKSYERYFRHSPNSNLGKRILPRYNRQCFRSKNIADCAVRALLRFRHY